MNNIVDNLSINICYIDKENSEEVLKIKDFMNLGYEYLLYSGEKFIRCSVCGILTRKNSTNDKYCKDCRAIIKNEQNKQYYNLGKQDKVQTVENQGL